MKIEAERILREGSARIGVALDDEMIRKMLKYMRLLVEWNKKINLTAMTAEKEIAVKHFLDSLAGARLIKESGSLADVGSGAGFPGMVLAVCCPGLSVTLIESIRKKAYFLERVKEELDLPSVLVLNERAEEVGRKEQFREKFNYAAARAVSSLNVVSEYCLPLVRIGGSMLAYKGDSIEEELEKSEKAISTLGGKVNNILSIQLPFSGHARKIVEIKKVKSCPEKYPRRIGVPKKRPL